jgi:hypothetical protein
LAVFDALLTGTGTSFNVNRILTSTGKELLVEWSNRSIFKPDGSPTIFLVSAPTSPAYGRESFAAANVWNWSWTRATKAIGTGI